MKIVAALVALAALGAGPLASPPPPVDPTIDVKIRDDEAIEIEGKLWRSKAPGAPDGGVVAKRLAGEPMDWKVLVACVGNSIENGVNEMCSGASAACKDAASGPGYLSLIYVGPAPTSGRPGGPYTLVGSTCYPDQAILSERRQQLTLEQIQREFDLTPLSSPSASIQPPGGQTLINLPIYYSAAWSAQGYQPGQVRSVDMLGRTVDLRIALVSYVYDHGDGTSTGPTASPGGPYPHGDITHAYTVPGTYRPSITATLTASYRIDGGGWSSLPSTATRRTGLPPVTVHTATNRLRAD